MKKTLKVVVFTLATAGVIWLWPARHQVVPPVSVEVAKVANLSNGKTNVSMSLRKQAEDAEAAAARETTEKSLNAMGFSLSNSVSVSVATPAKQ